MEKYRKFADPATGVNPFLPVRTQQMGKLKKLFRFVLGSILVIVRSVFILLFLLALFLYHNVFVHMIFIPQISRYISLITNLVLLRLILLCLGFWKFETSFELFKKGTPQTRKVPRMNSGFLVLCNHTSPVDILYLTYLCSPIFTKIVYKKSTLLGDAEILFAPLNFNDSMRAMFSLRYQMTEEVEERSLARIPQKKLKLNKIITDSFDHKQGPVVLFFEGALTNGTGMLEIDQEISKQARAIQIQWRRNTVLLSISYSHNNTYSPVNTTRKPIWHFLSLMMNFANRVQIKSQTITTESISDDVFLKSIKQFYVGADCPQLSLNWRDYKEFLEYWEKTQTNNYIEGGDKKKD